MSPAPLRNHQEVSLNLLRPFSNYLYKKPCNVFHAPFDVRLPVADNQRSDEEIYTVVQPDIVVVCDRSKLDRRGCIGAPDLIIEILSPSTAAKDLKEKYAIYEEAGVQEYWIVHPQEGIIDVFLLQEQGIYQLSKMYTRDDTISVGIFDNFSIDLRDIFEENVED